MYFVNILYIVRNISIVFCHGSGIESKNISWNLHYNLAKRISADSSVSMVLRIRLVLSSNRGSTRSKAQYSCALCHRCHATLRPTQTPPQWQWLFPGSKESVEWDWFNAAETPIQHTPSTTHFCRCNTQLAVCVALQRPCIATRN